MHNTAKNDSYKSAEERFFQPGTALNRVLAEAPYLPRCSDDKTATRVRPREYAIRYPYMQINRPGFVSWLIFDLDHSQAMIWEDVWLPAPNLIVRNRASGHSHLYYAITPVCTTEAARPKPIAFMKAVYAAFAQKLKADPNFHSGPVAKTPGHPWWVTHELHAQVYELGTLADYVELEVGPHWQRNKTIESEQQTGSRHCMLFEQLRHYAYAIVNQERKDGSFTQFSGRLENYANNHNNFTKVGFSTNLPYSSIKATVKSVARWTWDRYSGSRDCNRGVMRLDKSLTLSRRQELAALRTHSVRQNETASKIHAACKALMEKGDALTQIAISRLTGLTRQTVARYKHVLQQVTTPKVLPFCKGDNTATMNVKYAQHQVTAPLVDLVDRARLLTSSVFIFTKNVIRDG